MKLLGFIFTLSAFFSTGLLAQTASNTSTTQMQSFDSLKWKQNLKIRYFGEYLGSSLNKWDDNQIDNKGERLGTPANLWNLFNFQYKFLRATSITLSPRFFTQVGDRNELRETDDPHVVVWDDFTVGLNQEFYRGKTLSYTGRLAHRHPTSGESQNREIDSQIEWQNDFTWVPSPSVSILFWNGYRYYVYEPQVNSERYRISFTTLYNFHFNDKWKCQFMHDVDLQHRAVKYRTETEKEKDWNYFDKYRHTLAFGIGYSPVKAFTVMPFIKALNDDNVRAETMQVGFWLFGNLYN